MPFNDFGGFSLMKLYFFLSLDDIREKPQGPGFYQDHYSTVEEMAAHTMQAMSQALSNQSRPSTTIATTAAAGLFEPHSQATMNYALKPEKGLPPTPPGNSWEGGGERIVGIES